MDPERENYAELDRPPKRCNFSPLQKIALALGIACGLAPLQIELAMWVWARWGP